MQRLRGSTQCSRLRGDDKGPDVVQINMVRHDVFRQVTGNNSASFLGSLRCSNVRQRSTPDSSSRRSFSHCHSFVAQAQSSFACIGAPETPRLASVLQTTYDELLSPDLK